ncbi:class I SAM-dependent methyltransferase [Marinactinospora thermotolerans]|uniref:class I SAM-dependent methyltransferase n=1 Tax=Marinactinospora thermotolerans TaxID=531310 RepID=UPI003D8B54C2
MGAGGGQGTRLAAEVLPEAEVLAVEPSPLLRGVLLSRVAERPDLRERVSVVAEDLLSARLPERICGALAMNVIGHFDPDGRERVWSLLARRLSPRGRIALNLSEPLRPARVPRAPMGEARVGRGRCVGWAAAEPSGPESVTWYMEYEVHDGLGGVRTSRTDYTWWTLDEAGLRAETARHGLAVSAFGPAGAGLFVLSHGRG